MNNMVEPLRACLTDADHFSLRLQSAQIPVNRSPAYAVCLRPDVEIYLLGGRVVITLFQRFQYQPSMHQVIQTHHSKASSFRQY